MTVCNHLPSVTCRACGSGRALDKAIPAPTPGTVGWTCPTCGASNAPWSPTCAFGPHVVVDTATSVDFSRCNCRRFAGGVRVPSTAVCPVHGSFDARDGTSVTSVSLGGAVLTKAG